MQLCGYFHVVFTLTPEKSPQYILQRSLSGSQRWSDRISNAHVRNWTMVIQSPPYQFVTVSWRLHVHISKRDQTIHAFTSKVQENSMKQGNSKLSSKKCHWTRRSSYLFSFCLKHRDKSLNILHKEWPWAEEKEFVSHKNSDAEPTMKSPSLCIFQKECVTQNMTTDFIPKEDRTLLSRTHLYRKRQFLSTVTNIMVSYHFLFPEHNGTVERLVPHFGKSWVQFLP